MPAGAVAVRWAALFSSPFFHPTVLVERDVLERHELRYDTSFEESEDYELWSRLLDVADGDNLPDPLVLYRVHAAQASQRRRELQRECQLRVARPANRGPRARALGRRGRAGVACRQSPSAIDPGESEAAVDAYLALVAAFERRDGAGARAQAARDVVRVATRAAAGSRARLTARALRLDPGLPTRTLARRRDRRNAASTRREAEGWLRRLSNGQGVPIRVAAVFPEPTPYRAPLLDRIAASSEIDLTVIYAAGTVAGRTWRVEPKHRAVFLRGLRLPGAQRVLHHDYPVTPGVVGALMDAQPDVVVVSGWSTFAAQAAITWCGIKDIPYMLVVESHDEGPRAGWRRTVKGTVVPPIVERAAGVLVTGTLARDSMIARGAHPERVRVFANTDRRRRVRRAGRSARGRAGRTFVARSERSPRMSSCCPSRASRPRRGSTCSCRAVAAADDPRLVLVVAGEGPERARARASSPEELSVRLVLAGDVDWERIVELYVAADVFALLSEREPWAVVVNEAAACGLPLVLSDRVGAAHDLLRDGENGALVRAGDVDAAATGVARARRRSRAASRPGRPLARARARLGLRAERRGVPRGGTRGCRRSKLA